MVMYQSIPAVPPPPRELAISKKKMAMSPPQGLGKLRRPGGGGWALLELTDTRVIFGQ